MLHIALVILTATPDGAVSLAVSPADDIAACEANRAQLEAILKGAEITVLAARCGQTDLTFSPFYHGAAPEDEVHRYRVTLPAEGYVIAPLAEGAACSPAEGVFCARSAQGVE